MKNTLFSCTLLIIAIIFFTSPSLGEGEGEEAKKINEINSSCFLVDTVIQHFGLNPPVQEVDESSCKEDTSQCTVTTKDTKTQHACANTTMVIHKYYSCVEALTSDAIELTYSAICCNPKTQ